MQVNLGGGADLLGPLEDLFGVPMKGRSVWQVFVMTDGQVGNSDRVISLCATNASTHRCFTLGIGGGADAGLVEGIASATGGRANFVGAGDDFGEKVIPQLGAAVSGAIASVAMPVEGREDIAVAYFPIRPISYSISETIVVRDGAPFNGSKPVLVTGQCCGDSVDITVSANREGVSAECLEVLFAYESIRCLERLMARRGEDRAGLKAKCIDPGQLGGVFLPVYVVCWHFGEALRAAFRTGVGWLRSIMRLRPPPAHAYIRLCPHEEMYRKEETRPRPEGAG